MRLTGGGLRGRLLAVPDSDRIRPTSDRVREAVFNILAHASWAPRIEGARVLDLFAGTGSLGFEALSRGAAFCVFVDNGIEARALIQRNIEAFGLQGVAKVFRRDAAAMGEAQRVEPAAFAFLDPPYGRNLVAPALKGLLSGGWLAPDATIVIEEREGGVDEMPDGFSLLDRRTYGATEVIFARARREMTSNIGEPTRRPPVG